MQAKLPEGFPFSQFNSDYANLPLSSTDLKQGASYCGTCSIGNPAMSERYNWLFYQSIYYENGIV